MVTVLTGMYPIIPLWIGWPIVALLGLLCLAFIIKAIKSKGMNNLTVSRESEAEKAILIRDTKVQVEAKDAEKATGMEVNRPAQLSNVSVSLSTSNVRNATGFSTNQGLNTIMMSCSNCKQPIPIVYVGNARPQNVTCCNCGAVTSVPPDKL